MKVSDKTIFFALLRERGLPLPTPEYRFHPTRRWRMDYAWVEERVFLEVDGGVWTRGRHTRGDGWTKDTEKLNEASVAGFRALRCTPSTLCTDAMLDVIARALRAER